MAHVLIEALAPLAHNIAAAFIYGSIARGAEAAGSDIDLLIIGSTDLGTVIDMVHPAQQRLGREVNPKVFSKRERRGRIKAKDAFASEVLAGAKMFLVGNENELEQSGRHKP